MFEPKKRAHFVALVSDYYETAKDHVLEEHKILKKMEKQNRSIYAQRGELHEDRRLALVEQKEKRNGLKKITDELSSICDLPPLELPVEQESQNAMSIDIYHPEKGMEIEMDDCWEDEDQRKFYTDFPDLKSIVPMVAWKDSEKVRGGKYKAKKDDGSKKTSKDTNKGDRKAGAQLAEEIDAQLEAELENLDEFDDDEEIIEDDNTSAKEEFDRYIKNLMTIYNRELVDEGRVHICPYF